MNDEDDNLQSKYYVEFDQIREALSGYARVYEYQQILTPDSLDAQRFQDCED
jgi:hypothetical protein